jgi:hypothetical protein
MEAVWATFDRGQKLEAAIGHHAGAEIDVGVESQSIRQKRKRGCLLAAKIERH